MSHPMHANEMSPAQYKTACREVYRAALAAARAVRKARQAGDQARAAEHHRQGREICEKAKARGLEVFHGRR